MAWWLVFIFFFKSLEKAALGGSTAALTTGIWKVTERGPGPEETSHLPGHWPPPSPPPGLQVALTHLEAVTTSVLKATLLARPGPGF